MRRGNFIKIVFFQLLVLVLLLLFLFPIRPVRAGQQDNVNYILKKIQATLSKSLNSSGWKSDYTMVSKNIEDLKKTLEQGGKITFNPVKAHYQLLEKMLEERRAEYQMYCDAQEKLQKNRKKAAKQAINDVGMEMIGRLTTPVPSYYAPISQAKTKNAEVIKKDFKRLKTIDDAIKTLEGYKISITPSIHAIRDRKHAMVPLLEQFPASSGGGFDGKYSGKITSVPDPKFTQESSVKFTVIKGKISGTILLSSSSSDGNQKMKIDFNGSVDSGGKIVADLSGTDNISFKSYKEARTLQGSLSGTITQNSASGVIKAISAGKMGGKAELAPIKWKAEKQK